ncbi:RNA polymerase sigma factor [Streptomyces yunnanensis]|uniref:DNA-directed RNA polymerase specialized sigma subunit, sigma24 family n=1 Tax=Streptomyces yunnanensis TaxID=156453 RepID=A0A9X8R0A4_9ACTN|nr:sigma-70 family RNA polymerase sigma factor [Streptomyces yunnanensis]SHN32343.1 DNA-directed RNA polymerase specialized sigma subunit, sigma24 family [Streptomyces yunnanensis]
MRHRILGTSCPRHCRLATAQANAQRPCQRSPLPPRPSPQPASHPPGGTDDLDARVTALLEDLRTGPVQWDAIDDALARYGCAVLRSWITHGTVFARVRALTGIGLPVLPGLLDDPDDAGELAALTVATALDSFHRTLHRRGWDPQRGAGIRTFFIGQCLLTFPTEYRRWLRERCTAEVPADLDETDTRAGHPPLHEDPADIATRNLEALAVLSNLDTRTRTALWALALGYSHHEIADLLGTTPKGIEMLLYRCRRRHRPCSRRIRVPRRHCTAGDDGPPRSDTTPPTPPTR